MRTLSLLLLCLMIMIGKVTGQNLSQDLKRIRDIYKNTMEFSAVLEYQEISLSKQRKSETIIDNQTVKYIRNGETFLTDVSGLRTIEFGDTQIVVNSNASVVSVIPTQTSLLMSSISPVDSLEYLLKSFEYSKVSGIKKYKVYLDKNGGFGVNELDISINEDYTLSSISVFYDAYDDDGKVIEKAMRIRYTQFTREVPVFYKAMLTRSNITIDKRNVKIKGLDLKGYTVENYLENAS